MNKWKIIYLMLVISVSFAYTNSTNYIQSANKYLKIGTQEAIYDAANSYYRAKKYKKAINLYKKIEKPSLKFKTLYNLGNAYALNGNLQKAKESYEKALKLKKDKDAKYNLKLIEKLLKKHKKKNKQNKSDKKKKQQKNHKIQKNKNNKQNKNKNNNNKQNKTKNSPQKVKKQKQQKESNHIKKEKQPSAYPQKKKIKKFKKTKETNTTDIRNRYYELRLKQLKFNTLLLPLRSNP